MFFTDGNGPTSAASEKACTFTEDELARIERAKRASHTVVTTRPQSLGYVSIACIIINRMVGKCIFRRAKPNTLAERHFEGTGIFKSPTVLMQGTDSVGVSLIFWVLGALLAMAGVYVFAEFGLAVPRLHVEGQEEKECVPRNGGEKNYVRALLCLSLCIVQGLHKEARVSVQEAAFPCDMSLRHSLHCFWERGRQRSRRCRERGSGVWPRSLRR